VLTITTAATDTTLLTTEELRLAIGLAANDASQDVLLAMFNDRATDALVRWCNIADVPPTPPTFRQETLTEVFRMCGWAPELVLSRRPVTAITSVVVDDVTYDADEYEIHAARGILRRLIDDAPAGWAGEKITVVYTAGWATVPPSLKAAAMKSVRILWSEDGPNAKADPNLKRTRIEGVGEQEFWVGAASDPLLSMEIQELLAPFRNDVTMTV